MAARAAISGLALSAFVSANSAYSSISPLASSPSKACGLTTTVTQWVTVPDPRDAWATPVPVTTAYPVKPLPYGGSAAGQYHGPAFLPNGCDNLKPGLPQNVTNGNSGLGTPDAPTYGGPLDGDHPWGSSPPWKGNPPIPPHGGGGGKPSGVYSSKEVSATKSYSSAKPSSTSNGTSDDCVLVDPTKIPNTGKTRKYDFTISYRDIRPDGVLKHGIVVNGGFPGPTIEANWGDMIEVTVHNKLDNEGTTIHWHGLLQKGTQFMDGVPSVQQCPIAPGSTYTYTFRADTYGTTWYHSHYSAQYSGGAYGAIIIHGPSDTPKCANYDKDLGPVLVGDWYHDSYYSLVQQVMNTVDGRPPPSNNNLVNGKNNYPCQNTTLSCTPNAGLAKFKFTSGQKYRLRLINPSSDATQKISIDGHKFTVIAQDFVPIVPYETDLITLGIGQRSDVIVEATGSSKDSVWFRSTLGVGPQGCSLPDGISPNAMAVIYYEDADPDAIPTTTSSITEDRIFTCTNDPLTQTVPQFPISADVVGDLHTETFNIDFGNNGTNFIWTVNGVSARVDYDLALLNEAQKGTLNPKPEWNVYDVGGQGTVRIIMYNSFPASGHPMHLHGHDFQVLAEGFGDWDGVITNPSNPSRRDTQILTKADGSTTPPTKSYVVIQFVKDNPGIWALHCHLAWHVSAGLYVNLVERADDIKNLAVPAEVPESCTNWAAFTKTLVPDQIDSGV